MIHNRRADWRRIKSKLSYTFDEAARTLRTHRNTVRHWVKHSGLTVLTDSRPHLILGGDLIAFLKVRRQSKKRKCAPGELYCFRCRMPRQPVPCLLELRILNAERAQLVGLCSVCETVLHRFVSRHRIAAVAAEFNMQFEHGHESLVDTGQPALNCHLETVAPSQ
jgi:hypothetical protein